MIVGRVILVEDSADDEELAMEAFRRLGLHSNVEVIRDGEDAIQFFAREGETHDVPAPQMILLDLKLSRVSGHQVLQKVRSYERLQAVPVVIFTSSELEQDRIESYRLGASAFVQKPVNYGEYIQALYRITADWMKFNKNPVVQISTLSGARS